MITREQVADLRAGDVVELQVGCYSIRGPLDSVSGELRVHIWVVRDRDGLPYLGHQMDRTLTVISRAKPPLYVNSDKTEPDPGDVVRDADDGRDKSVWLYSPIEIDGYRESNPWRSTSRCGKQDTRDELPARLRLLVDGRTGQVVP